MTDFLFPVYNIESAEQIDNLPGQIFFLRKRLEKIINKGNQTMKKLSYFDGEIFDDWDLKDMSDMIDEFEGEEKKYMLSIYSLGVERDNLILVITKKENELIVNEHNTYSH